jgi:putative endonuclease
MFYTYVLWSKKYRKSYTGSTKDFQQRFKDHNSGDVKSSRSYHPYKLLVLEEFDTIEEAFARERFYKTTSGRRILRRLIDVFEGKSNGEPAAPQE